MKIPESVPWRSTGKTLGSGGQGAVALVKRSDDVDGPDYALKALRNVGSAQARDRFRREIEVVKQLAHTSIIKIHDHSKEGDAFQYYVMEYHEGAKPLSKIIASSGSNPFHGDVLKSLELFEKLISAISACEKSDHQIVHRDINPKNILLLPDETIRLIDFGICQIQDGAMITLTDEDVGTRNYTSPECEAGTDTKVGVHSDIYSASKVLWSAITSQRAFAREAPVFGDRSMERMFPTQPETWHLAHIFEKTIRQKAEDRFGKTSQLFERIRDVRHVVQRGLPPVGDVKDRCPSCGWRRLEHFIRNTSFSEIQTQRVLSRGSVLFVDLSLFEIVIFFSGISNT